MELRPTGLWRGLSLSGGTVKLTQQGSAGTEAGAQTCGSHHAEVAELVAELRGGDATISIIITEIENGCPLGAAGAQGQAPARSKPRGD